MKREGVISSAEISVLGPTSTNLITPDHVLSEVVNMMPTLDGGLVNAAYPEAIINDDSGGVPSGPAEPPDNTIPVYGTCHSVFHACIRSGERDILLLHTGNHIWELTGWTRTYGSGTTDAWSILVAPSGTTAPLNADLQFPGSGDFPDQYVATPTGIIILPAGGPVMFYDGDVILPLGYPEAPGPPIGHGPGSSANQFFPNNAKPFFGVNDTGYTMDGLDGHPPSKMFPVWKGGRVGTIDTPGDVTVLAESGKEELKSQVMGYLLPGLFRSRCQYIDLWGNLSPLSGWSNNVEFKRQPAMRMNLSGGTYSLTWVHADLARKQVAWEYPVGPDGTIGRLGTRTKDMLNSGDVDDYVLPRDAMVTPGAFATLPDNVTGMYPDNIPDAWLVQKPLDVAPFPQCRLAEMCFGRVFYANVYGDEGALFWSEIGRWGTVLKTSKMYPDPSGAEITCIRRYGDGLFCFTENTIFRVVSNDSGDGYKPVPTTSTIGTIAPSSVRLHRNGMLVFLGSDGNFYGFDGESVRSLWSDQKRRSVYFNRGIMRKAVAEFDEYTGEYKCWVSTVGGNVSTVVNDRCYAFDGAVWRWYTTVAASGVCVTRDQRKHMIVAGYDRSNVPGVWLADFRGGAVDTSAATYDPEFPENFIYKDSTASAWIKTGWITSTSNERKSVFTVYLRLRETGQPSTANRIAVKVRKNYRADVVDTHYIDASYNKVDATFNASAINPTLWGTGTWGGTGATWRRRRPFFVKVDINVQMAESFQLEFYFAHKTEILGFYFDEKPREVQGAMSQRGART